MPRTQTQDVLAHIGAKIVDVRDVAESKSRQLARFPASLRLTDSLPGRGPGDNRR
jgi:hypothetical protein